MRARGGVAALGAVVVAMVATGPAQAASKPRLRVATKPAVAAPGAEIAVSGRVKRLHGARTKVRVVLERRAGRKWRRMAAAKLSRKRTFVVRSRAPQASGHVMLRVRLVRGRHALATTPRWNLSVSRPAAATPPPTPTPLPVTTPTPTPTPAPTATTPPAVETVVVSADAVKAAPAPGAGGTLRLSGGAPIEPGDVLAGGISDAAPYGFLLKATSVRADGGDTLVDAVPATLLEAIPTGHIDETIDTARKRSAAARSRAFREAVTCEAGGQVTIEGSVQRDDPTFEIEADWGVFSLNYAQATASIGASAHASASATGAASCNVGPIKLFETKLPTISFTVGPVPIVLVPELEVSLTGLGKIDAAVATSVDASIAARAGARYEDGDLSPIAEIDRDFDYQPPDPSGTAKLEATLATELELEFYGAGGPEFTFNAGLDFNADIDARDPWWTLDAPLSFTAGLELDVLDLEAGPITVFEKRIRLAEAPPREPQYRVVAGGLQAAGSGGGSCIATPCEPPINGGWSKASDRYSQADDARFSVASPTQYKRAGEFAATANIDSWAHSYTHRIVYGSAPCANAGERTTSDGAIRHPGGTHPSIYRLIGEIQPPPQGGDAAKPGVALRRNTGDFGNWTLNQAYLGIGWPYSNGQESLVHMVETSTSCEGSSYEADTLLLERHPFEPLYLGKIWGPAPTTTDYHEPVTYGEPRCGARTCVVRVSGVDGFDDAVADGMYTQNGSVRMTWWFDVETCWGGCA